MEQKPTKVRLTCDITDPTGNNPKLFVAEGTICDITDFDDNYGDGYFTAIATSGEFTFSVDALECVVINPADQTSN